MLQGEVRSPKELAWEEDRNFVLRETLWAECVLRAPSQAIDQFIPVA